MWMFLLACAAPTDSGEVSIDGIRDLTMDFPDPPEGGMQMLSPVMTVGPYEERLFCHYGVYEGEDIGVVYMAPLGVEGFTHHNQLKAVYDDSIEPGTTVVCPDPQNGMPVYAPLFESVGFSTEGGYAPRIEMDGSENWISLPEGIAFKLQTGQRWVMDMHYVNTTGDTLLVNAAINIGILPAEEVKMWAGPIQFDSGELAIQPHEETTVEFTCPFPEDYTILSLTGHMHDHGTQYQMSWVSNLNETPTEALIYEVSEWGPLFREYPRINNWEPGQLEVKAGDGLKTRCTWYNDTDKVLSFPYEMCTSSGVMYPLEEPLSCFGDQL